MTALIIIGAGGFGLEVAAYANDMTRQGTASFEIKGFLDDTKPVDARHGDLPILGGTDTAVDPDALYAIALGTPVHRRALHQKLAARGARFAKLVHPSAHVAATATIGEGSILAPFTFAGPSSRIGPQCVLNIYASVAHESDLAPYCVLAPYAGTHAEACLGEGVFLGAQAVVTRAVKIGNNAKVAAAAVAYADIPDGANAIGNPARYRME